MEELLETIACQLDRLTLVAKKIGIVMHRVDGSIEACDASAGAILNRMLQQVQDWSSIDFSTQAIHLDGSPFPGKTHWVRKTLRLGQPYQNVLMGLYRLEGSLIWLLIDLQPLFRDAARPRLTRPDAVAVTFADMTGQI